MSLPGPCFKMLSLKNLREDFQFFFFFFLINTTAETLLGSQSLSHVYCISQWPSISSFITLTSFQSLFYHWDETNSPLYQSAQCEPSVKESKPPFLKDSISCLPALSRVKAFQSLTNTWHVNMCMHVCVCVLKYTLEG